MITKEKLKDAVSVIKDALFIIGPLFTFIIFIGGLVIKNTDTYKQFESTVEFGIVAKDSIIPKFAKIVENQEVRIKTLESLIDSVKPKEREEYAIGLRYNSREGKYYYRDNSKINREVFYEGENGLFYYRDRNDIKRYINL